MVIHQINNYWNNLVWSICLVLLLLCVPNIGWSQSDSSKTQKNNGKSGYANQLEQGIGSLTAFLAITDDEEETFLRISVLDSITQPWFQWKKSVNDKIGLQVSTSYTTTNQFGENSPYKRSEFTGSGIFKIYSRWTLVNRNSLNNGTFVVNVDHRHKYTQIAPSNLGFELGYNGIPALLFSDARFLLLEMTWQQKFNKGRTGVVIGRYDPNDYFDVLGYVNPFTTFQNLSILANSSIALADTSTGIGIGHYIKNQFLIQATVNDANSTANDFEFFQNFNELYTSVEFSWTPSRQERFYKNFHVMAWHSDERVAAGIEEGRGIVIGANWTFHETFMPFFKAGWSEGSAPIYSESYTGGFIIKPNVNKDLIGFGLNWGKTQKDIGQLSTEIFYRFQFSQNFAITPSFQYFSNPALDLAIESAYVFGLRGRVAL